MNFVVYHHSSLCDSSSIKGQMSKKLDFQKLVEGADQLNRDFDQGFNIQRNVEQINESAQRLASKSIATSSDYSRNKA